MATFETRPVQAIVGCLLTDCGCYQSDGSPEICAFNYWAPYGPDPSIRNLVMKFYADDTSELSAFMTGQLDVPDTFQTGTGIPPPLYSYFEANPDWVISPTQGTPLYHGIFYNLDDTSDGSGTAWHWWGCSFQHGNSLCGVEIRQAFAHLLDRPRFVTDGPLQGSGVALADDLPANKIDPFTHQVVASSLADQCSWDTLYLANGINSGYQGKYGTCLSAFNIEPDAGGFAAPGSPDFCAAVDHLIRATIDAPSLGLQRDPAAAVDAFGNHCGIDPNSPGLPNIRDHPMRAKVRSTDPRRTMGQNFASVINTLFAGNVVNTIQIGNGLPGRIVFVCCSYPPYLTDDWEWYTFGYQDYNPYPTTLYSQFDSQFASNLCGGQLVIEPTNPTFVCIPAADGPLTGLTTTVDPTVLYNNVYAALNVLGQHAVDLPAYTFGTRTAVLSAVANPVNAFGGIGYSNPWTFLSAHKSNYVPQDSRFQFDGGGPADTIRWGQAGGYIVSSLNPYISQWIWEFNILGEVYDTLFAQNPVSPTQAFCWICNSYTRSVDAQGNTHILAELRQNLRWQDGVPLDAKDVKFSLLTERDVSLFVGYYPSPLLDVKAIGSNLVDIVLSGQSIEYPGILSSSLIIPRHIWQQPGDTTYGDVGFVDPAKLDYYYDPVASGTFIGSGPFMCRSVFPEDLGRLGTGCITNSDGTRGGENIGPGGTVTLTRYDRTGEPGNADPFNQWFRSNNPAWGTGSGNSVFYGQFQEFSWADKYDNATVTTRDLASVAACYGKSDPSGCADYSYWLRPAFHPSTPNTVTSEVAIVASHLDDTWVFPFSWNGNQSMQPGEQILGITTFTP